MKLWLFKEQQGQTLVEAVFIITVVAFILSGSVAGVIYFARVVRAARMRSWAARLAQEKIEQIRAEAKANPERFWANPASYSGTETLTSPAQFTRQTTVSSPLGAVPPRRVKITVQISWQEGPETKSISAESYLKE